jgi:hypothetical protein
MKPVLAHVSGADRGIEALLNNQGATMAAPSAAKTRFDSQLSSLSSLYEKLERLEKKASSSNAKTIAAALESLRGHIKYIGDLRILAQALIEIQNDHESQIEAFPSYKNQLDLAASILAFDAVIDFLHMRALSPNLLALRTALIELAVGAAPVAMLQAEPRGKGRRVDSPMVGYAKGILAGMMDVQLSTGMSRQEAAQWIARNVSPELARKISSKPITARMVEEWRDRYGGPSGEEGLAREKYLLWRNHDPVSAQRFREITEQHAKRLLDRKPR